jgi:hypothetical protein
LQLAPITRADNASRSEFITKQIRRVRFESPTRIVAVVVWKKAGLKPLPLTALRGDRGRR